MRIEEHSQAEQAASSADRAMESQRIQVDTTEFSSPAASAGDRVDLSGTAGRISQAMHSLSLQSAQRAGQLQKEFQAGRYQPDPARLANIMMGY